MEVPICVIRICLLHVVLQLHQGFLLKLLYLPGAIQAWMICHIEYMTDNILAVYFEGFKIKKSTGMTSFIQSHPPGLNNTIAFR